MKLESVLKPVSSEEYANSSKLNALDAMKFIMAFSVVAFHCGLFRDYSKLLWYCVSFGVSRMGVPFFFLTSSWLLFRKFNDNKNNSVKQKKYILRLVVMYGVWTLVYLPYILFISIVEEGISVIEILFRILLVGYDHLWYLIASIYGTMVVYFFVSKKKYKALAAVSAICFIIGLLLSGYNRIWTGWEYISSIYFKYFISVRTALFFAVPYISCGFFLSKYKKEHKRSICLATLALFYILHIAETLIILKMRWHYTTDFTIMLLPFTVVLVYILIHVKLKDSKIWLFARNSSICIYLVHMLFITLFRDIFMIENSVLLFIATVIACILFSMLILSFEKYKYLRWLKYLH